MTNEEERAERRREYARAYYHRNKAKYQEAEKRWRTNNKERKNAAQRKWRANNRERYLEIQHAAGIKLRYGITREEYARILRAQANTCAVCGEACSSGQRLSVDHCHGTGKVRGLLCAACNRGIGCLKDAPEILRKAAEYLER